MTNLNGETHGTVLVLSKNGIVKKERMIIRRWNTYHSLDVNTGNVVEITDLHLDCVKGHDSAESIVKAYQERGYEVTIKPM